MNFASRPTFAGAVPWDSKNLIPARSLFMGTSDQTIGNTTTETTIFSAGAGSLIIPANTLVTGSCINISGNIRFSTSSLGATLTGRMKLGGITIGTTSITNLLLSASNNGGTYNLNIFCRAGGVSGAIISYGDLSYANGSNTSGTAYVVSTSPTTINTTISNVLDVTLQWSNTMQSITVATSFVNITGGW